MITGVCDLFPKTIGKRRWLFVLGLVTFCYVAALPTVTYVGIGKFDAKKNKSNHLLNLHLKGGPYIVNLLDAFAVTPALFVIVILEIIGVMYFYGALTFFD